MEHTNKTRLMAASGATLALIVAGTATVAAHPGDDRARRGFDFGSARAERGMLRGAAEGFERRETTVQTIDGTSSRRVEQGTLDSVSDSTLEFSLASGETVSVVIDEDTQALELSAPIESVGRRGRARDRMIPTQIEVSGIEAGTEIMVWSDAEDGADFVAQRVVVQPDLAEAADPEADEAGEVDGAAIAPVTDA